MPQAPSERHGASTDLLLGELIAEIRAVKHNQANSAQKLDAVNIIASNQTTMLRDFAELKKEQEQHNFRIGVLEADKNRREGAIGLVAWFVRNWPFTVIAGGLIAFVAWANEVRIAP